jgi:hypothetical protein
VQINGLSPLGTNVKVVLSSTSDSGRLTNVTAPAAGVPRAGRKHGSLPSRARRIRSGPQLDGLTRGDVVSRDNVVQLRLVVDDISPEAERQQEANAT